MSHGPSVARVGVIGAGFMGSGIAESAALGRDGLLVPECARG
jgi:3-hydroxyacyl-CoA dehydrogenase